MKKYMRKSLPKAFPKMYSTPTLAHFTAMDGNSAASMMTPRCFNPFYGNGWKQRGVIIVLHDITNLKRLEKMRSDFVANVSHELKTPVTSVKGFSETLLGGEVNDEATAKSFLEIIYNESERLDRLIR